MTPNLHRHARIVMALVVAVGLIVVVWGAGAQLANPTDVPPPEGPGAAGSLWDDLANARAFEHTPDANNRGVKLATQGRLHDAIGFFRRSIELHPDYLPGHKNLLAALVETERPHA